MRLTVNPNMTTIVKAETSERITVTQQVSPVRVVPNLFKVNAVIQAAKLTRPAVIVQLPDVIDGGVL